MLIFFDTETTGLLDFKCDNLLAPHQPHIVQLAAILMDDDRKSIGAMDVIVKPDGWEVPVEASNIHGITHERAMDEGIDMKQALDHLQDMAGKAQTAIAHNIGFDLALIKRDSAGCGWGLEENKHPIRLLERFCTMKTSTNLCRLPGKRGFKWPKLTELHQFLFGKPFEDAHSAMGDVQALIPCYFELQKRFSETANQTAMAV